MSAALARTFAAAGHSVALAARRPEKLAALCAETGAIAQACDAADAGQVDAFFDRVAAELVDLKVSVLVAAPAGSARAAKQVTSTVPIVFMGEPDPVGTGLVASLARPGGNVTGLADAHADLFPKRLQLLKEITAPGARVGVLWNPSNPSTAPQLKSAQIAGRALGLTLVPADVKGPGRSDVDQAFAMIGDARLGSLLVIPDPTLGNHRTRIAELSIKHRLPTSGTHRGWAEGGLLMSYGSDFIDMFRRGATIVDKILKGTKPADLPVEQPTKFEFVINLATARALGLTMPASLLARADQVLRSHPRLGVSPSQYRAIRPAPPGRERDACRG